MKQSKVLAFTQGERKKFWVDFQLSQMKPSLDPNHPPLYLIDVQGRRGDGLVFTITVSIMKQKYDLLPAKDALLAARDLLQRGIADLLTFTGCECTAETECEKHQRTVQ